MSYLSAWPNWSRNRRFWQLIPAATIVCFLWITLPVQILPTLPIKQLSIPIVGGPPTDLVKPLEQSIVGIVFYGRADRARILNCYLERNLPEHGGWLDEIVFVRNTRNTTDLEFLDTIVARNPRYKIWDLETINSTEPNDRFREAWGKLKRDTIYVKIDDDIVWLADDTIPRIVTRKLQQDDYLLVSANMINSPLMSKVHYDLGAYHPYLPAHDLLGTAMLSELEQSMLKGGSPWQYNRYQSWVGPSDYSLDHKHENTDLSQVWLRVEGEDLQRTPVAGIEYNSWGPGWTSWSIAAQSHLSLLENAYHHNLSAYYQGLQDEVWFTEPDRLSVNLVAVYSNDVLDNLPEGTVDDEAWLTQTLPFSLGKRVAVETQALAAHFAFGAQHQIETTDVLSRYQMYANDIVCVTR